MSGLRVLYVGRSPQRFVSEAAEHYRKRIQALQPIELVEVRAEGHSGRAAAQALRREGEAVLKRIAPGDTLVLLDERGKGYTTRQLADWLEARLADGAGTLTWLVGGAYGVDDAVRARANHVVALSQLTLPHQLARVVLLEQIYRALTLLAGHPYHHE